MNFSEQVDGEDAVYQDQQWRIEIERRRQIGLTIDPATAETAVYWEGMDGPYDVLEEGYHEGQSGREYFARNPDGDWVLFDDLPKATRKALWERDGHKPGFAYGVNAGDDL
jgi:hypothetical protein